MSKWAVVIPSYRKEQLLRFIEAWGPIFEKHKIVLHVVWDGINFEPIGTAPNIVSYVYDWSTIDRELQQNGWIIPRQTDCVRSFGFYKAWKTDCDYILTLDDDVRPIEGFDVFEAYEKVFKEGALVSNYFDVGTMLEKPQGLQMRGFPFQDRVKKPVMLQYGMWAGVPDLDGMTQLVNPISDARVLARTVVIPKGTAVTGCIMNCAFRREFAPNMYQLLMGKDHPFDRWGDIWSGLIAKHLCDCNDWAVVINGWATVQHNRASDVNTNIKKEASGYMINEELWGWISTTPRDNYLQLVQDISRADCFYNKEYSYKIYDAVEIWTKLFSTE